MASLNIYRVFVFFAVVISVCNAQCIEPNVTRSETELKNTMKLAMEQISQASRYFSANGEVEVLIKNSSHVDKLAMSALSSCRELLVLAMDNLNNSLSSSLETPEFRANLRSWICAAGYDLQSCIDGFDDEKDQTIKNDVVEKLKNPMANIEKCTLDIATIDSCPVGPTEEDSLTVDEYPRWLSPEDRELLEGSNIKANVVVAKDGSGNFVRVSDAVKTAPRLSKNRFVIYVKKGLYNENVKIENDQWNVMMYGDGMDQTIISGNRSKGGGSGTLSSATFSVYGQGFIARDMKFENTAGAINMQAVALASTADRSVFYKCRFDGYQDTLFAHSNRQFYRECRISGTVDFIFGGASAVIQRSNIFARKPLKGQQNAITAHYRDKPQCPTAIVVQSSTIQAAENLAGVHSYLGRPWTAYATVVFMRNSIDGLIDPEGWLKWNSKEPPSTIFLAEYGNKGAGANTAKRVKWPGVKTNLSDAEASKFTVKALIQGDQWIPATQVPFDAGL